MNMSTIHRYCIQNKRIPLNYRYEVEYDENRITIAKEIGTRFLDIECSRTTKSGTENNENHQKCLKTTGTAEEKSKDAGGAVDIGDDKGGGGRTAQDDTIDGNCVEISRENESSQQQQSSALDKENSLVLDVLNDDIITKVQDRITSTLMFTCFLQTLSNKSAYLHFSWQQGIV